MPRNCGKIDVRCWSGSTAAAIWLVLVDRIKDRITEQVVNIPVLRMQSRQMCSSRHMSGRSWSRVERVQVVPPERMSDRMVEQLVENSVSLNGKDIVEVVQIRPLERVQQVQRRTDEQVVDVPFPRSFEETVEAVMFFLHEQMSERIFQQNVDASSPQVVMQLFVVPNERFVGLPVRRAT